MTTTMADKSDMANIKPSHQKLTIFLPSLRGGGAERVMVTQNSVGASPTDFSGSGSSAVGGGFGTGPHVPQHSMLANR